MWYNLSLTYSNLNVNSVQYDGGHYGPCNRNRQDLTTILHSYWHSRIDGMVQIIYLITCSPTGQFAKFRFIIEYSLRIINKKCSICTTVCNTSSILPYFQHSYSCMCIYDIQVILPERFVYCLIDFDPRSLVSLCGGHALYERLLPVVYICISVPQLAT